MLCPHCGAELPYNAVFCGYCGRPLPTPSESLADNATSGASMGAQTADVDAADEVPTGENAAQAGRSTATDAQEKPSPQGEPSDQAESQVQTEPSAQMEPQAKKQLPATRHVMVGVAIVVAAVVIAIIAAVAGSMKG